MTIFPDIYEMDRPSRMRWLMITFGFLATVLNYVHRLSFNYLAADGELRRIISDEAFGYIGTSLFYSLFDFQCLFRLCY